MQADIIKELDLAPLWIRKQSQQQPAAAIAAAATQAAPPTTAVAEPSPPPITTPITPAPPPPPAIATPPTETPAISTMDWRQLRATAESCRLCGLCEKRRKVAFGAGDQHAKVMFIGEAPGEEEDKKGDPFVGNAGQLLDLMLHAINLNRRHNVYIANIVKCRPPSNRDPTAEEASKCLPYLHRQIELLRPQLLVALGRIAATYLLNADTSIAQLRQKILDYQSTPLVVTYHPAYLLRSPQEKRKSWEDLKFIRKLLAENK